MLYKKIFKAKFLERSITAIILKNCVELLGTNTNARFLGCICELYEHKHICINEQTKIFASCLAKI